MYSMSVSEMTLTWYHLFPCQRLSMTQKSMTTFEAAILPNRER